MKYLKDKRFQEIEKKIREDGRYHFNVEITNDWGYNWCLYDKNMSNKLYFSKYNKPILSSDNGNTIDDLEKFVKENVKKPEKDEFIGIIDILNLFTWLFLAVSILVDSLKAKLFLYFLMFLVVVITCVIIKIKEAKIDKEYKESLKKFEESFKKVMEGENNDDH